ncbi:hypothetical protein IT402_02590 [Candidatus Nomurabacteria bacterium]|nr:hypothetical protein [Candidatus Nomurabacteria bacterium]
MAINKLFEPEHFCILSPDYYKVVMESASHWVTLAYDTNSSKPGWYKKNIFTKVKGYVMTGFKINWPDKTKTVKENDVFDMFDTAPIQMLFVPETLYYQINSIKKKGCKVKATAYGSVKTIHNEYGKTSVFCLMISEFTKELDDKEIRNVESIDAVVGGY